MKFVYRVRDPLGKVHEGQLEAGSLEDAAQQLRRDGFYVLDLQEAEVVELGLLPRRVSKQELIYFTTQLALMVDTGIPLAAAIGGILEQETNPTLRKVLGALKRDIEAGEDFSTALEKHPKLFGRTYVALVKASEASGTLGPMLDRIAGYLRKELETRSKVRAAMAYPMVMLGLAIGVTIFLLTYILPKFIPLFASRGVELPKMTRFVMGVSEVLLNYWYFWLGGAMLGIAGFCWGRRTPAGRQMLDWLKIQIPILGPMFRKVAISRSLRTLGTMLASGVPMLDALRLSAEVAGNCHYEKLWQRVLEQVTGGKRICEVLATSPLFPRVLVQMIAAGEETGQLDTVLQRVSTYYDQEVEMAIKTTTSMIEPLMISLMGVVVGGIGMALLLPIFSLSRHP
ncbi:MAG: type II secretion system F family protein [Thermoguttaceae bacterium]|nr:type II secretion system F family protein [Thermoguttaceae bacterium]MDW8039018.1 type II secretion system F family protein [Thermoguttaceae bacterium]